MARRTDRRAESRHRPVSSTETGVTTPGGKHGPASSTESRDTKGAASMAVPKPGTASMAVPKHGAASKARPHPSVRIQYGSSKNTTPPTGPEHSRRASQPPPGVNSEHYPQVSRFQYGLNDTTPAPPVGPKPSRRSTEQRRGRAPSDPYLTDDSRRRHGKPGSEWGEAAETGSTAAPDHRDRPAESAKVGDRHHRKADPDSDEAFLAAAASARLARLKYESNKNRPAGTLDAGPPIGTSAAERVRTILGPGAPAARKTTKGGLAPAEAAASRGDERNAKRLREANAVDRETLGESPSVSRSFATDHLPGDAALFFPAPAAGPCDEFAPPAWFWAAIQEVCATTSEVPTRSPIRFEMTDEASTHNADILRAVDFDLGRLIQGHGSSTLGFGSEFRKLSELRPLIGRHPHFPRLESLLTEGMHYVFDRELSHDERMVEMIAMLARGNHKSAQVEQDRVGELLAKDVVHGFTIPLPISIVKSIPGAMIQPLGLVQQWTVGDDGERKAKFRLTQDLSFSTDRKIPPTSINKRVDMSAYVEMVYGWCLPRIVHFIVALRSQNPWLLILISKYDYSDAYRRIAHSAAAATQTIAINGATAFLSLRLTFGGSPNPPTWCMFSELVTDLANEIAQCDEWDPNECRSPAQPDTPEPLRLPAGIPIVQARRMALHIPPTKAGGRVDGFIDDLINVFLDTPSNCARQPHIVPLAMHLTSRPHAGDEEEPLPRRPILSIPKLIAEGRPEEIQIVLGWRLNTRLLEISLPDDKYLAWSTDVRKLRAAGHCGVKDMETLVGRLNHTAYIIPNARHFMSRIRRGLETRGGGNRSRKVGAEALEDLLLWEEFLEHANKGVSMNLLVTREPNKICWSDACPYGLGGYSLSGRAWRLLIPRASPIFGHQGINNLLEFVGMAINIWLACLESAGGEHCILAIGDNTSAIGWLHNSSRLDTSWDAHTAHLQVARKIATLLIDFRCCLASQHLKGELNVVADLLSFAGDDSRGKSHPIAADMPANDELTCAGELRNLTAAGRDFILDHASSASRRVIFDGRQESSNESYDRTWRRWNGYCAHVGYGADPLLTLLSVNERDLFIRAFLDFYRNSEWDAGGRPSGDRREPVVASTLRKTASNLATAFRSHIGISPLHLAGSANMRPSVRAWLKACDNIDPPKRKQKAATPQLLRAMFEQSGAGTESTKDSRESIIAEIAIAAYFFAMRSCEITATSTPGRTKIMCLKGIVFRDARHREIPHSSRNELRRARRVTVTFENQKNGLKMDKRTHERTGDNVMCPVRRLSSLVLRILDNAPNSGPETPVSTILEPGGARIITSSELRRSLRSACTKGGGASTFGYSASEIGTRSIRSGAAMGLFLMNHPVAKIMILGRWSSDAFLDYIRPQVLEWTNQLSTDMIRNNSFFDAADSRRAESSDPRTRAKAGILLANGSRKAPNRMHLHH